MVTKESPSGVMYFTLPGVEAPSQYINPRTRRQLQEWLRVLFGLEVPDTAVCPGHCSPLDAALASYFATAPVVVWKASRGFGGKTSLLAAVSMLELMDGADVSLLGGSGRQSQQILNNVRQAWNRGGNIKGEETLSALSTLIPEEPSSYRARTTKGNELVALTASTKSARGPHPQRLRMDEVDEMKMDVYTAAMGQAMDADGIQNQTTLSSTHQYPDGTMTEVLKEAADREWPVFEWCWRESSVSNKGWLSTRQVEDKKQSVPAKMWQIEYDLQEPSPEGRLFTADSLLSLFSGKVGTVEDRMRSYYEFEKPKPDALYSTGADWARDLHNTVIATIRYDVKPARLVAYERRQHEPYPLMVDRFDKRLERYPGKGIHDAIGVGAALEDYIATPDVINYNTKSRETLFSPYILAVEAGKVQAPVVNVLHTEHRYCRYMDIFGSGHPPDGMVAMALAWLACTGKAEAIQNKGKPKRGRIGKAWTG